MNRDHISLKLPREEGESEEKEDEFTMYVMDLSYFSGKLECYFNYQVTYITTLLLILLQLVLQTVNFSSSSLQHSNATACRVSSGGERNPVGLSWAS